MMANTCFNSRKLFLVTIYCKVAIKAMNNTSTFFLIFGHDNFNVY